MRITSTITVFLLLISIPGESLGQKKKAGDDVKNGDDLPRVVIGPAARSRDRIAIPTVNCSGASRKVCSQVTAQLRRNLELSTYFEMVNPKTYVADMKTETLTQTKWPDWFNVGARYLVKARISGAGSVNLEFRLYNVVEKKVYRIKGQSHHGVSPKKVHSAVNAFINGVILTLTGSTGMFGTHFVYGVRGRGRSGIGMVEMDGHGKRGIVGGDSLNLFPHFGAGGGILYTSYRSGNPQLWIGRRRLTHDAWHYRGADISPNGQIVASLSKGSGSDLYILSSGGKIIRRLTRGGGQDISPSWSPTGTQIAFVSDRAGGPQIYVISAGGGAARRLTMAGGYNTTPDWGKNNKIAFTAMTGSGSDVFVVDLSGNIKRITQNQGRNSHPTWSPDGRYLAFISTRKGKGRRIWISSTDGRWQFSASDRGAYSYLKWGP
jgi:TolB protein